MEKKKKKVSKNKKLMVSDDDDDGEFVRQLFLVDATHSVTLISTDKKEDMSYLSKRALSLLKQLKDSRG